MFAFFDEMANDINRWAVAKGPQDKMLDFYLDSINYMACYRNFKGASYYRILGDSDIDLADFYEYAFKGNLLDTRVNFVVDLDNLNWVNPFWSSFKNVKVW